MDSLFNLTNAHKKHQSSDSSNTLISYSGNVDSEIVATLFAEAEARLDSLGQSSASKAKILGIMIEMLQNIVDHSIAEGLEDNTEASSFTLEKSKKGFVLSAGNKVYSRIIPHLKKRIEYLNSLTSANMTKLYRDILKNGNPASETSGLGLIDIIRKSGNPIYFKFVPSGNKYSVLTVRAVLTPSQSIK